MGTGSERPGYDSDQSSPLMSRLMHRAIPPVSHIPSWRGAELSTEKTSPLLSLFFHRACCYRTLFKTPTHALCFKIHTKTQSLFKTLECLRLLCHPTCFGHTLTIFRGYSLYNAAFRLVTSSQFYLSMRPYLLSVLLSCVPLCCLSCCVLFCTQQDRQQRVIHDSNTDR